MWCEISFAIAKPLPTIEILWNYAATWGSGTRKQRGRGAILVRNGSITSIEASVTSLATKRSQAKKPQKQLLQKAPTGSGD